ncbi:glycosyltransferase family 2 protein [Amphritea sp.]|uniref:glycosyltransferase family 2 protein n=1 Tax=Amphritea sp. TaxID=1872502 RepID=UPI0025B94A04|nr:glycosyltransferase family 2 protein [Amphritea sp.]
MIYDLSIIIVSWNTSELLKACLGSVFEKISDIDYEVIVVDNFSSDDSVLMVEEFFPQVKLIKSDENLGFSGGNNIGTKVASGRNILYLNSDTLVVDDSVQRTFDFLESDADIGMISCRINNTDGTLQPNCSLFPSILNMLLFVSGLYKIFKSNRFFGREKLTWWAYDSIREVDVLSGCFMMIRKEVIVNSGLMDDVFFMYYEETDWCFRIKNNNWKIVYIPYGGIIHHGGGSAAKLGATRANIKDKSALIYMKKNWGYSRFIIGAVLLHVFYLSRLPLAFLLDVFNSNEISKSRLSNHLSGLKSLYAIFLNVHKEK